MIRRLWALGLLLVLAACSGGGGGGGGGASNTVATPPSPPLTNFAPLTIDAGPAILNTGPDAYTQNNVAYVSVTLCAPGTTNCQTIDHVLVDTGSVGLRIFQSVLSSSLAAALPLETDTSANPVGECYGYLDGYVFGSVRQADFQIGGEAVSNMPLQVIADTGGFSTIPSSCSSGGGSNLNTVQTFGANGIIGVGLTSTDCGATCTSAGGTGAAIYYDCPAAGCSSIIGRSASTTAPFQQLPNPVAALPIDNNGVMISLPAAPAAGQATATGTLYFGIGTQTNNGLGSATVYTTTNSSSSRGAGFLSATYKNQTLSNSFIDSGSNLYLFVDRSIAICTQTSFEGYYCPASPTNLSPTIEGANGVSGSAAFTLNNAQTVLSGSNAVAPGVGGNPGLFSNLTPEPSSFDFGLPFFYGRNIYTAIEGRNAGGTVGPYFAF